MRISLNNVWLTNDGVTDLHLWTDAHDVQFNGEQIVQDAQFLRALVSQPMARGNAVNTVRFSVTRQYASVAAAATTTAVLTSFTSLPTAGTATLVCGALGELTATCTFAAVLAEMPSSTFRGTRTETTFVLRGGAMTTTSAILNVIDGASFSTVYCYPLGGTVDGGNLADALVLAALDVDAGGWG